MEAFMMTIELWVFLAILAVACAAEDLVRFYRQKTVDNPALR
jgi:hypothetical protein